jgi:hypothetical protein
MKGTAITTMALIGAGDIRSHIARLAVANDKSVMISNSPGPKTLRALVVELGAQSLRGEGGRPCRGYSTAGELPRRAGRASCRPDRDRRQRHLLGPLIQHHTCLAFPMVTKTRTVEQKYAGSLKTTSC